MAVCSCITNNKRIKSLNKDEFRAFIDSFDVVLSDCDGVLWRETEVIKRSPDTVKKFRELGKKFFYITNNNCKTRNELVEKCNDLSYDATEEDILCTSYLTAVYLKQRGFKKKAYIVGSQAIARELEAEGISSFGVGPDSMKGDDLDPLLGFEPDPEVGAVIIGFDKHFSYPKLIKAATYAHKPEILFVATNPDVVRPSPNNNRFPEAGCLLRAIEAAASRRATILGKPEIFISEVIKQKYDIDPSRTLMIGDSLSTDILLGKRCGFTTLLVMSGITTSDDLKNLKNSELPNFCADQLSDILDCFENFCTRVR